jgi:hypothetical protein
MAEEISVTLFAIQVPNLYESLDQLTVWTKDTGIHAVTDFPETIHLFDDRTRRYLASAKSGEWIVCGHFTGAYSWVKVLPDNLYQAMKGISD